MTMPRYAALIQQWNEIPPAELLIAAYFGVGIFDKKRKAPEMGLDSRGLPIRQRSPQQSSSAPISQSKTASQRPPTLDEKPGGMKDLIAAFGLKPGQSVAF